jgi:glucose/arabinose dehydrogenase
MQTTTPIHGKTHGGQHLRARLAGFALLALGAASAATTVAQTPAQPMPPPAAPPTTSPGTSPSTTPGTTPSPSTATGSSTLPARMHTPPQGLTERTAGAFTYLCGGIGQDEQEALRARAREFDMQVLFTRGARGEYLADVEVRLTRGGKEVANFMATGPRCLIKGPRGTYQIAATHEGTTKRATLRTGQKNLQMRW